MLTMSDLVELEELDLPVVGHDSPSDSDGDDSGADEPAPAPATANADDAAAAAETTTAHGDDVVGNNSEEQVDGAAGAGRGDGDGAAADIQEHDCCGDSADGGVSVYEAAAGEEDESAAEAASPGEIW